MKPRLATVLTVVLVAALASSGPAWAPPPAGVSVTPGSGGDSISADTFASGELTALGRIRMRESTPGDIGAGSVVLDAPDGFEFGTDPLSLEAGAVPATPSGNSFRISEDAACPGGGDSRVTVTPEPGRIVFYVCSSSLAGGKRNNLSISSVTVRPGQGTPLASGDVCLHADSEAVLSGVHGCDEPDPTSFARLVEVAGALTSLVLDPPSALVAAGEPVSYTSSGSDAFGNLLGDRTAHTAFSITPDGSCTGSTCTPAQPGPHTVAGDDGGVTGSATIDAAGVIAGPGEDSTVDSDTGSVMPGPDGKRIIAMPRNQPSDIVVTSTLTCPAPPGGNVTSATLVLAGSEYPMTQTVTGAWTATIPAAEVVTGDLSVFWTCPSGLFTDAVARVELYDPSGIISHGLSQTPMPNASVTLYQVQGYRPETAPDEDPTTCQTTETRPPTGFDEPPPSDQSLWVEADPAGGLISPAVNPFITNAFGVYGWFVAQGCYFVIVEKPGFLPTTSPMVGVPPLVTDLDLSLFPEPPPSVEILEPADGTVYVAGSALPLPAIGSDAVVVAPMKVRARPSTVAAETGSFSFAVDGSPISDVTYDAATNTYSFEYVPGAPGSHTITATATNLAGEPGNDSVTVVGAG